MPEFHSQMVPQSDNPEKHKTPPPPPLSSEKNYMITMVRAPCCEEGLKKGRWTDEEDEILAKYIQAKGEGCWKSVPKNAGLQRCGKSCRLRWINYLRPELKRGNITAEEEHLIIRLHASMGNRWSIIAAHLPGRTDNEIKNYWNSHLCRKHLTHHVVPNAKMAEPVGSTEIDDEWKRRRGPSRHQETSKSTSAPVEYTKMSMSMFYKEEHDVMRQDAKEESFEITDYINQEGEDNTTQGLNTGESLIFSSSQPSYFNQDHIDVLFSPEDPLNIKAKETEVHAADQKTGSKSTDASKSLSISSVGDAWDDWDWNVGDGHELIDDNEILSMLWDDDSDF